jgi:transmembrane sensor
MTSPERMGKLFFLHMRNKLSSSEKAELSAWRNESPKNEELFQKETNWEHIREEMKVMFENKERAFEKFKEKLGKPAISKKIKPGRVILYISNIAATLLIFVISFSVFTGTPTKLSPGTYTSTFFPSNGSPLILDDLHRGFLAGKAGISLEKKKNGDMLYIAYNDSTAGKDKLDSLVAPKKGMFSLRLPDGTLVWLNAQSTISYPANFSQEKIEIIVTGEAYFETAKTSQDRLIIRMGIFQIKAADAHFNLRMYPDEPLTVSMISGAPPVVRLNPKYIGVDTTAVVLQPGEQIRIADLQTNEKLKMEVTHLPEMRDVAAWKDDKMLYLHSDIEDIMNDVSRWYDAEIVYKGKRPDRKYFLDLPRNADIVLVLDHLEQQGVRYSVKDRTIKLKF